MQISINDANGKNQTSVDLNPGDGIIISAGSAELAISVVRTPEGCLKITGPFNVNNKTIEVDVRGLYLRLPSKGNRKKIEDK